MSSLREIYGDAVDPESSSPTGVMTRSPAAHTDARLDHRRSRRAGLSSAGRATWIDDPATVTRRLLSGLRGIAGDMDIAALWS